MHPTGRCNCPTQQHSKTPSREKVWLCSKPHPQIVVHDNGTKFTGTEFQEMLSLYNIKAKQTTVKNPTANSLVKQIRSTLKGQLHMKFFCGNYIGEVDYLLQIALFAIRAAMPFNCTYSPSQLAYGVDMFFCQQIHIDWLALKAKCQQQSMANN
jgi:transposase InsO family protein